MGVATAIILLIVAVALFLAVQRGYISNQTIQTLASIAGIVALLAALAILSFPPPLQILVSQLLCQHQEL